MYWYKTNRADKQAALLADRHYSRQSIGSRQFMPPGRTLVLLTAKVDAVWGTSFPYAEYVKHQYPNAFICSIFRNESDLLSSDLIRDAVAATRFYFEGIPQNGFITFVDSDSVISINPGYCFKCAGFKKVGITPKGLTILKLAMEQFPPPVPPIGMQLRLNLE